MNFFFKKNSFYSSQNHGNFAQVPLLQSSQQSIAQMWRECILKVLPAGSICPYPDKPDKWKCTKHNVAMERCSACRDLLYTTFSTFSTEEFLAVCQPVVLTKNHRKPPIAIPPSVALDAHQTVLPANDTFAQHQSPTQPVLPQTPLQQTCPSTPLLAPKKSDCYQSKKPRLERGTLVKHTVKELMTAKELEKKRKQLKKKFSTWSDAKIVFSQYALPCAAPDIQKYQLFYEVDNSHKVRENYKVVDLYGKDSYLLNYSESRRNAVINLCRAVSRGNA